METTIIGYIGLYRDYYRDNGKAPYFLEVKLCGQNSRFKNPSIADTAI